MESFKHDESIIVFTYKDANGLIKYKGSSAWKLNKKRAAKCKYLICTHNQSHPMVKNSSIKHGTAFLIGKISKIIPALASRDLHRALIEFDEYAEISIPGVWKGWRNPVVYKHTKDLDVDLNNINFIKAPDRDNDFVAKDIKEYDNYLGLNNSKEENKVDLSTKGISIPDAKRGLSLYYDIEEENIEIILKG